MAKFRLDQRVYAPIYRYPNGETAPFALQKGTVRAINPRSCEVEIEHFGRQTIATSLLHSDVGVCVVRIGDFTSELSTMDPICKSILNFLRLLLPDDQVMLVNLRTEAEFEEVFQLYASAYTLWIIVGHGTPDGHLCFTRNGKCASSKLASTLAPHASAPKTFLFLSCHTGRSAFAKAFSSKTDLCHKLIGPTGPLHSAVATQFAHTFLSYLFLEGRHAKIAFKRATEQIPTATKFRLWKNGRF